MHHFPPLLTFLLAGCLALTSSGCSNDGGGSTGGPASGNGANGSGGGGVGGSSVGGSNVGGAGVGGANTGGAGGSTSVSAGGNSQGGSGQGGAGVGGGGSGGGVNPDAPGDVGDLVALPANGSAYLSWTPPTDADYSGVLVLSRSGAPVADVPTIGTSYTNGATIGASTVVFAADGTNLLDTGLSNGTTYHYRAFAYDADHNYAPGAAANATPRDPHPGSYTDHIVADLDAAITSIDIAIATNDDVHLAVTTSASYYYATCSSGCDSASDWQLTWLEPVPASNRPASIVLDAQNNPRITYRVGAATGYRACNAGCNNGANWSTTQIPSTSGNPRQMFLDSTGAIWIAGGGSSLELSHCASGCASAANWTTAALPVNTFYIADLQVSPLGQATILSWEYTSSYQVRFWSCAGNCTSAASWSYTGMSQTQGSVPPMSYRFTADGLGMRGFYPPGNADYIYATCDSCAPSWGSTEYTFPSSEVYNGHGLELTAHDQPRVYTELSTGATWYRTCDYRCDLAPSWSAWQASPGASFRVALALLDNELPFTVWSDYGSNGQSELNARKPSP